MDKPWLDSWGHEHPPASDENGLGDFFAVGRLLVKHLKIHCGFTPSNAILDVGCGSGRLALSLARELSKQGRYEGFDIREIPISWCQQKITPRFPNFQFRVVDILNHAYQPEGHQNADSFVFPYEDKSFDTVILTSVFTHMRPDDVRRYLHEIRRVLKPNGRCFITWFALNTEARELIAEGKSGLNFNWQHGECWAADERAVEIATAYEEDWIRNAYEQAGFQLTQDIILGYWPGRPCIEEANYQDYVVATPHLT